MTDVTTEAAHADLVERLLGEAHLIHMALGVAGEAGELVDAIKRAAIYGKPLNLENVIEELGDLEFYLRGIRGALGISRSQVLRENIRKLDQRYHGGTYSDQHASERADKLPAEEN